MRKTHIKQFMKGVAVATVLMLPVPATSVPNAPSPTPELPPATAAADLSEGATAVESRQYDLATKRLTRAIESGLLNDEAQALAYHHRGIARQKLGFDGLAIMDYTVAMKLNALPKDVLARAYYNRALAKSKSGDTQGAELDYSHAIEIQPTYAAAYHNRANLERERADYPTAVRDYSLAIDHLKGADQKLPLMGRALSHRKMGDIAAASSDLDALLRIDPSFAPAAQMRRELATLPASTLVASRSAAAADNMITGSIGNTAVTPRHGEVLSQTHENGWTTKTTRYADAQLANDNLETGALRDIDLVPAPGQQTADASAAEPVTRMAAVEPQAAIPAAPRAASATATASGNFKMQLGAFRAAALADQAWSDIQRKAAPLVESLDYTIEEADLGERGIYFRLQAGAFETAEAAKSRCNDFAARQIACIVVAR
jgi:tetratricopeptide (TPR) repeat protein